jgi:hypothetical protein
MSHRHDLIGTELHVALAQQCFHHPLPTGSRLTHWPDPCDALVHDDLGLVPGFEAEFPPYLLRNGDLAFAGDPRVIRLRLLLLLPARQQELDAPTSSSDS